MSLAYSLNPKLTPEEVAGVFRRSGIRRPVDDLPRLGKMLAHANLTAACRDGEKLVGVARALTDFSYCTYLSDLAVDRAYQKRGVGKELVRMVREAAGEEAALLLVAAPEAVDYYPRIGFEKIPSAWAWPRKR